MAAAPPTSVVSSTWTPSISRSPRSAAVFGAHDLDAELNIAGDLGRARRIAVERLAHRGARATRPQEDRDYERGNTFAFLLPVTVGIRKDAPTTAARD